MLDPREADTVEELAELAVSFFGVDLSSERCSVMHGDEQHRRPAVQYFAGFGLEELDLLDWIGWTWEGSLHAPGAVVKVGPADFRGRNAVLLGLHGLQDEFLGFFHLDRAEPFEPEALSSLQAFRELYQHRLLSLLCPAAAHGIVESPPVAVVQMELGPPESAWMDCY